MTVYTNKTVVRSMEILELFIDYPELTFQEIIELSGMPKTSVYRMLISLEEMGFLEKGSDAKYRLGLTFLKFGSLVSARLNIREVAYPIMKKLHDEIEEAINLTVLQGDTAVYVEKIDLKQKVRLYTAIGRQSPLFAGACSRVILAYKSDEFIRDYLERTELKQMALGTITDVDRLYEIIEETRKNGYTVSCSELENHTCSIAAPIFNHEKNVIAGISIAGLEANYTEENIEKFAKKAMQAASEISEKLGYRYKAFKK